MSAQTHKTADCEPLTELRSVGLTRPRLAVSLEQNSNQDLDIDISLQLLHIASKADLADCLSLRLQRHLTSYVSELRRLLETTSWAQSNML